MYQSDTMYNKCSLTFIELNKLVLVLAQSTFHIIFFALSRKTKRIGAGGS